MGVVLVLCSREMLSRSVVEQCSREVLWRSIVKKSRSVAETVCREVL